MPKEVIIGFPRDLQRAIHGLNDEKRQRILLLLNRQGRLSFADIQRQVFNTMKIQKNTLSHHLKILVKSLLIEHFYDHKAGVEHYSYYKISPFGKRVLESLYKTLK